MVIVLAQLSSLAWPFVMRAIGWVFVPNSLRLAVLRVFGAQIGRGVLMRPRVRVTSPARLAVGEDSWIGEGVTLDDAGSIRIGANVVLSQAAVLRCPADARGELVVEDGAWIALRARVTGPVPARNTSKLPRKSPKTSSPNRRNTLKVVSARRARSWRRSCAPR